MLPPTQFSLQRQGNRAGKNLRPTRIRVNIMPNNPDLYVNTQTLQPTNTYVCWIDIMGTKNAMSNSFEQASNHILRFHACCIKATNDIETINHLPQNVMAREKFVSIWI